MFKTSSSASSEYFLALCITHFPGAGFNSFNIREKVALFGKNKLSTLWDEELYLIW